MKDVRYQYILCSTTPRSNIRLDEDNLIVKARGYEKDGLVVNGYNTVFMELKCVINFIY